MIMERICPQCDTKMFFEKPRMPDSNEQRLIYVILCPNEKCINHNIQDIIKSDRCIEIHNMTAEQYEDKEIRNPGQIACAAHFLKSKSKKL